MFPQQSLGSTNSLQSRFGPAPQVVPADHLYHLPVAPTWLVFLIASLLGRGWYTVPGVRIVLIMRSLSRFPNSQGYEGSVVSGGQAVHIPNRPSSVA